MLEINLEASNGIIGSERAAGVCTSHPPHAAGASWRTRPADDHATRDGY